MCAIKSCVMRKSDMFEYSNVGFFYSKKYYTVTNGNIRRFVAKNNHTKTLFYKQLIN